MECSTFHHQRASVSIERRITAAHLDCASLDCAVWSDCCPEINVSSYVALRDILRHIIRGKYRLQKDRDRQLQRQQDPEHFLILSPTAPLSSVEKGLSSTLGGH
jgi:hypothetical protein